MCWSAEASIVMTGAGLAATTVALHRQAAPAILLTLSYFTVMEALQVWGYAVVDQCELPANQAVTRLSYLHIAAQPIFINAFAMELVPDAVKCRARRWVFGACVASMAVMLLQVAPLSALGPCLPGSALCADRWCTVSGDWHIAWDVPYNGLLVPLENWLGLYAGFPTYMVTVFLVPLMYGAWRFVLVHALAGPVLAAALTTNPNEMPAIWCLFSIAILFISLSPLVRRSVSATGWYGRHVEPELK